MTPLVLSTMMQVGQGNKTRKRREKQVYTKSLDYLHFQMKGKYTWEAQDNIQIIKIRE